MNKYLWLFHLSRITHSYPLFAAMALAGKQYFDAVSKIGENAAVSPVSRELGESQLMLFIENCMSTFPFTLPIAPILMCRDVKEDYLCYRVHKTQTSTVAITSVHLVVISAEHK